MTCLQVIVELKSKIKLKIKIVRSAAAKRASWSICHACYLLPVVDSLFGTCLQQVGIFVTSHNQCNPWELAMSDFERLGLKLSVSGALRQGHQLITLSGCFQVCSKTTWLSLISNPRYQRAITETADNDGSQCGLGSAAIRQQLLVVHVATLEQRGVGRGSPNLLSPLSTDHGGAGALFLLMIYDD